MPLHQGIPEISARQLHLREALISRMPHSLSIPYTKNFLSQGLELLIRCMHCCGTCPSILVPDLTHTFMKFKPKFYAKILHRFIVSLPWVTHWLSEERKNKITLYISKNGTLALRGVSFPKMTNKLLHSLTRPAKIVQFSAYCLTTEVWTYYKGHSHCCSCAMDSFVIFNTPKFFKISWLNKMLYQV
jgi:hypothetical protein